MTYIAHASALLHRYHINNTPRMSSQGVVKRTVRVLIFNLPDLNEKKNENERLHVAQCTIIIVVTWYTCVALIIRDYTIILRISYAITHIGSRALRPSGLCSDGIDLSRDLNVFRSYHCVWTVYYGL